MKQLSKLTFLLGSVIGCFNAAYATNIPNTDNPTTFLGPTLRLGYTSSITNTTAFSFAGEAGIRNFRIGGTFGWKLAENQLFKISAEYLLQNITYSFFAGNTNQWVNQGALGAAYQYDFGGAFDTQFDLSAYISHAPSKNLSTIIGTYINSQNMTVPFILSRRIAGSTGDGISPGINISPWTGGRIGAELNYDNVRYNTINNTVNEDATGLGVTLKLSQALMKNVDLGLAAAVRQPFNNYAASLNWNNVPFHGDWSLGLFGDYTVGKNTLPDTWNIGLSANYFIDNRCPAMVPANLKNERNLKGEMVAQPISDNLLAWTADPAVYMPQVLAIVDQKNVCDTLSPPTLLSPLPDFIDANFIGDTNGRVFNSPTHFGGSNLTYSLSGTVVFSAPINPVPANQVFSINPQTGAVTLPAGLSISDTEYALTITASNGCTSTSTTFLVEIDNE